MYGPACSDATPWPTTTPSMRNSTFVTPVSSEAVAAMSTAPATVAPAVGKVMATVGAVVSEMPPVTVTERVLEVAVLPAAS